ncbi:MAG: molybdenum cofactor guanylyltransferase MobA [Rhizomicrobium sp.]|nr:molybdenum cofactor guanylyltransferase MobA [Rhizomicrobium sp.]
MTVLPPAVILAGGRSSRMGVPDKCLLPFKGQPIITQVITTLTPQVSALLLNTNSDPALFAFCGLPLRADVMPGFQGPLAGILTGMLWAREAFPQATHIASVPADMPNLPADLIARLQAALEREAVATAIAVQAGRRHSILGLWPLADAEALEAMLRQTDVRALWRWIERAPVALADFSDLSTFANINTKDDLGC